MTTSATTDTNLGPLTLIVDGCPVKLTAIQARTLATMAAGSVLPGETHHWLARTLRDQGERVSSDIAYDRLRCLQRKGLIRRERHGRWPIPFDVRRALDNARAGAVSACHLCDGEGCEDCSNTGLRVVTIVDAGEGITARVHGNQRLDGAAAEAVSAVIRAAHHQLTQGAGS